MMVALAVDSNEMVHKIYDKAIELGAKDEGPDVGANQRRQWSEYGFAVGEEVLVKCRYAFANNRPPFKVQIAKLSSKRKEIHAR